MNSVSGCSLCCGLIKGLRSEIFLNDLIVKKKWKAPLTMNDDSLMKDFGEEDKRKGFLQGEQEKNCAEVHCKFIFDDTYALKSRP